MKHRGRKSAAEQEMIAAVNGGSTANRGRSSPDHIRPPSHLSSPTRAWYSALVRELAPHQYQTLQAAAEAWDRKEQARAAIAKHGLSYQDAKGMFRARPEVAIERDSRFAYFAAMRALKLDKVEPPDHNRRAMGVTPWKHHHHA
jgi:hypothetical protein